MIYKGIRVLDASRILVGPYCTMMLSDLGAEVIKVESHEGDETRNWGPPYFKGLSTYFLSHQTGIKRQEKGKNIFYELAKQSDVMVENFNSGVTERLGIDYETISKINPRIVYASINGFGHDGPWKYQSGFDYIVQATSGLMSITGMEDGPPTKVGVAICDIMTAMQACSGIQGGLFQRERSGRGCLVETSLYESTLASLVNVGTMYLDGGEEMKRMGNMHPSIVPYGVFKVGAGHIMIGAAQNNQFIGLCKVIGREGLSSDERFVSNKSRVENRETLVEILEECFKEWSVDGLERALIAQRVPVGKIQSVGESLRSEQSEALGMVQEVDGVRLVRSPLRFDRESGCVMSMPPQLNEHRDYIMKDVLGFSEADVVQLVQDKVLLKSN